MPAINAMMTHEVDEDAQGELQGAIASLMGISAIVSPFLGTQLFGQFAGPGAVMELPGAPFFLTALLSVVALWVFVAMPLGARTSPSALKKDSD